MEYEVVGIMFSVIVDKVCFFAMCLHVRRDQKWNFATSVETDVQSECGYKNNAKRLFMSLAIHPSIMRS
jgi:hypothetical protein